MKLSSILLFATCVLMAEGSEPTTPGVSSTVGFSGCPSSLTWGGGVQKYRFVEDVNSLPATQYLPCSGDIDSCVYTAHRKFYCMNGNKPDYTPMELNPTYDNVLYQNVSTYAGNFIPSSPNFTTVPFGQFGFAGWIQIKFFPNLLGRFPILGGFILTTIGNTTHPDPIKYKVGFTDLNPDCDACDPVLVTLDVGVQITEAFGYHGDFIDTLTVGKSPVFTHDQPELKTVGGSGGYAGFDATPPPHVNGPCALQSLSGQTFSFSGQTEPSYIQALEFHWKCVGKPTCYGYHCEP